MRPSAVQPVRARGVRSRVRHLLARQVPRRYRETAEQGCACPAWRCPGSAQQCRLPSCQTGPPQDPPRACCPPCCADEGSRSCLLLACCLLFQAACRPRSLVGAVKGCCCTCTSACTILPASQLGRACEGIQGCCCCCCCRAPACICSLTPCCPTAVTGRDAGASQRCPAGTRPPLPKSPALSTLSQPLTPRSRTPKP